MKISKNFSQIRDDLKVENIVGRSRTLRKALNDVNIVARTESSTLQRLT